MNIDKILNIGLWCCIPLGAIGIFVGGENGTDQGARILFKAFGLALFIYGMKCIRAGKETFLTINWSSNEVTKKDDPGLFWLAMMLIFFMAITCLFA